jgi:(E)-4-hydroxy-3-methylbut-2-enyl-diphosphate synthase
MVYGAGKQSHTIKTEEMVEHIVELVTAKAEAMKAAKAAEGPAKAAAE